MTILASHNNMTKFVIVGIQRTGTTLIRTTIDSHPDILCLGEVFNAASGMWIRKERKALSELWARKDKSYGQYVSSSLWRRLGHIGWRKSIVTGYLDWLYGQQNPAAIGFKFMLNHMRGFPSVAPYLIDNQVRVIHVVRENVFDVHLSRLAMAERGMAHSTVDDVKQVKVGVPVDNLINELVAIRDDSERWSEIFQKNTPYMRLSYEVFVANKDREANRVMDFLGVSKGVMLESALKKMNKMSLRDTIENFDEVRKKLTGTAFEWCIQGRD